MVSLDQVLLLQEKVETAVRRITDLTEQNVQLKNENDALRSKCAELSKALSEKTELVSSFENQQDKIEKGIISALKKLDGLEDAVLSTANEGVNTPSEASGGAASRGADEPSVKPSESITGAFSDTIQHTEEFRGSLMQKAEEFEDYAGTSDASDYAGTSDASDYAESPQSESTVNDSFDIF